MKLSDIPFNVGFHFDENLREVPDDPAEMAKAIDFLLRTRKSVEDPELVRIYGWLSVFSRILGDLEPAHWFTVEAISIANEIGDMKSRVQNRIRLASVYQWQSNYNMADLIYESVVLQCELEEDVQQYLDFALQHFGKSLFEQGRYRDAAERFQQALDIRLASGNEELIASSRYALDVTLCRLGGSQ